MSVGNLPQDLAQQALDAIGIDYELGDLQDGSEVARVVSRHYGQCLRQLLRSAHWNFARKTAPLQLLADATGNTSNVGTNVIVPWIYEYAYPTDCMKARFIPQNWPYQNPGIPSGNIEQPDAGAPQTTGIGYPLNGQRLVPSRWLEATDYNYTDKLEGAAQWETPGQSPMGRTVLLSNVKNAVLVYTTFNPYPNMWDALFRSAFIAYLAQEIAFRLHRDKNLAAKVRADQIMIAKQKVTQARISDGNEGWYRSDIATDWMRIRSSGTWGGNWGTDGLGPGYFFGGWDALAFADGTAF